MTPLPSAKRFTSRRQEGCPSSGPPFPSWIPKGCFSLPEIFETEAHGYVPPEEKRLLGGDFTKQEAGKTRSSQEIKEEEEEEEAAETTHKSEVQERAVHTQLHSQLRQEEEEEEKSQPGKAFEHTRKQHRERARGPQKRVAEKAGDEETARFQAEGKGLQLLGGGHDLWQGAERAGGGRHEESSDRRHYPEQPGAKAKQEEEAEEQEATEQEVRKGHGKAPGESSNT